MEATLEQKRAISDPVYRDPLLRPRQPGIRPAGNVGYIPRNTAIPSRQNSETPYNLKTLYTPSEPTTLYKPQFTYQPKKVSTQPLVTSVASPQPRRTRNLFTRSSFWLCLMATLVFAIGVMVSVAGWHTNHVVQVQVEKLQKSSSNSSASSTTVPGTTQPSDKQIANYAVAPDLPKYLIIPKSSVKSRIMSMGLDKNSSLGVPWDIYDTAWYNESSEPGQAGAMLIDGHVASGSVHGALYNLKDLVPGDTLQVIRGDNTVFTYKVIRSQSYNANSVDMAAAMTPVVAGKPGLNLITCAGSTVASTNEYSQRLIVFTEQVTP